MFREEILERDNITFLLEKNFLCLFNDILHDKKKLSKAVKDRESIFINPPFIYVVPDKNNIITTCPHAYFFVNSTPLELIHVKNGKLTVLPIEDREKAAQITAAILNKKPNLNKTLLPLTAPNIEKEYQSLIQIIQTHHAVSFDKQFLSLEDCEKKQIFNADGTINQEKKDYHNVTIDENRIDIAKLYEIRNRTLTTRENILLDAAISSAHFELYNQFNSHVNTTFTNEQKKIFLETYSSVPKKMLQQMGPIKLTGKPFYSPENNFKRALNRLFFEYDMPEGLNDQIIKDFHTAYAKIKKECPYFSETETLSDVTSELTLKYTQDIFYFSSSNLQKCRELLSLLKINHLDTSHQRGITKSAAFRLIKNCHGLVKVLNFKCVDFLENPLSSKSELLDESVEFFFKQILDPENNRPKRRAFPDPVDGCAYSPLYKQQVDPKELEVQSIEHTVMTSTTLLPADGKMRLFNAGSNAVIALLFDLRLCDVVGQHFVFNTDTFTLNDWWHNPNAKKYQDEFEAFTINGLIEDQQLHKEVKEIRDYNEILAGVSAKAMAGIVLESPVDRAPSTTKDKQYYKERLNAIYIKLYAAEMTNRHLPIFVIDPHTLGVYQYSIEEQKNDLEEIIQSYPNNSFCKALLNALSKLPAEEFEENKQPVIYTPEIEKLGKIKNAKLRVYQLQDQINALHQKLFMLSNRQVLSLANHPNNDLDDGFSKNKGILNALLDEKINERNTCLNAYQTLKEADDTDELCQFVWGQDKIIASMSRKESQKLNEIILNIDDDTQPIQKDALAFLFNIYDVYEAEQKYLDEFIIKQKTKIKIHVIQEISSFHEKNGQPSFNKLIESARDDNKNKAEKWNSIFLECQSPSLSPFTLFYNNDNNSVSLINRSIANFKLNIHFNPGIVSLEELMITEIKRQAISCLGTRHQYEKLIEALKTKDLDMPLHTFLNTHLANLGLNQNDDNIASIMELAALNIPQHVMDFGRMSENDNSFGTAQP